jgi:hypothetical protein
LTIADCRLQIGELAIGDWLIDDWRLAVDDWELAIGKTRRPMIVD